MFIKPAPELKFSQIQSCIHVLVSIMQWDLCIKTHVIPLIVKSFGFYGLESEDTNLLDCHTEQQGDLFPDVSIKCTAFFFYDQGV
jgi:hypothetical protein